MADDNNNEAGSVRNDSTQNEEGARTSQTAEVIHLKPSRPPRVRPNDSAASEIASEPNWVCWRYAWDPKGDEGRGKWTKIPHLAKLYAREPVFPATAKSNDPSTWRTLPQAMAAFDASDNWSNPFDGVGYVFDGKVNEDGNCKCGLDFDRWSEREQGLYAKLGATYAEVSPSGKGVHVIALAKPFAAATCKTADLSAEAYCKWRYFTWTGRGLEGSAEMIEALPDEVAEVVAEIARVSGKAPRRAVTKPAPSVNDALAYFPPEHLDLAKLSSAVMALPDTIVADEGSWMNLLCRALANETMRIGDDPVTTEQIYKLLDARSRGVKGYSEEGNRDRFERCRDEYGSAEPPVLAGTIYWLAERAGWRWPPPDPQAGPPWSGPQVDTLGDIGANPPPRRWAYGNLALYREVTVIGAPGGSGKTLFATSLQLGGASGRKLLGHHIFAGPQRVLHISAEEDREELERKYKAAARHHQIALEHFANVIIRGTNTGDKRRIELVAADGKVGKVNPAEFVRLRTITQEAQARVVVLDPLNGFIGGGLSDNTTMKTLIFALKDFATEQDLAVIALHHTGKGKDLEDARDALMGASAITDNSRTAVTVLPMPDTVAESLGLLPSQARGFFCISQGKRNNDENLAEERWYRRTSVSLGNGAEFWPNGDNVGVVEIYDPAAASMVGPRKNNPGHDRITLGVIATAPADNLLRTAKKADRYYLVPVRDALRQAGVFIIPKDEEAFIKGLIDSLTARGLIREENYKDKQRKSQTGLAVTPEGHKMLAGDDPTPKNTSESEPKK